MTKPENSAAPRRFMRGISIVVVLFASTLALNCSSRAHDFIPVFFDDESAMALHVDAPLPRKLTAEMITRLHQAGARGLILKFFVDLPKDDEQDQALAKALCLMPTTLQACLCRDGSTNSLPLRFLIAETNRFHLKSVLSDVQGYIPLPVFSACARGVGFVDLLRPDGIPLIEAYRGSFVKSLYVTALELETGERANYSSGTNVTFGTRSLSFNEFGEHPIPRDLEELDYVPFHQVLKGSVPMEQFKGKVVIIGYDGSRIHSIKSPWGEMKAHRLFVHSLIELRNDLK
jgi:hypothetical protein